MKLRNMENSPINTDLAVMDYEEFKCFMKELATMNDSHYLIAA
ncbi:hypothetical protein [[Haemophilus] ducreyi]|nr:hypothetical protein [[Haemophilus] ducreyi]